MAPFGWVIDSFLKSALEVRYTFSAASESHLLAQIISSFPADTTFTTGNANLKGNAVAYIETFYRWSKGYHNS